MIQKNRLSWIVVCIALDLFLVQCGSKQTSIQSPDPDLVLATAGDQTATARDYLVAFQEAQSFDFFPTETPAAIPKIIGEVTQTILFERDLAQKARVEKLDRKDDFKKYHENAVNDELYQKVIVEDVLKKIPITEEDLKRFYDENREGLYCDPETNQIVVQGIYIDYGAIRSREDAEKIAQQAAEKIKNGAAFEAVAQEVSDASPHQRGKENKINPGLFDPEIAQQLELIQDGEITGAFELKAKNRFYIFKRIRFIEPKYSPFQDVRASILNSLLKERIDTGTFQLTQELRKKHNLLSNPTWLDHPEQYGETAILLSVPGVYELTVGEFVKMAKQQQKWSVLDQKEYLDFMGNKTVCLAEAKSRGWTEKDVALAIDFWDYRKLAKDYVNFKMDKQVTLTEEKIREIYDSNPQRYQTPARFDLSRLFVGIHPTPNMPSYQVQLLWAKAKALAAQIHSAMKAGMPFEQVSSKFSQNGDIYVTTADLRDITLADLSPNDREILIPKNAPPMRVGNISEPQQIMQLIKKRFGYEIFYLRSFEPSRPMTYEEAREAIGKYIASEAIKTVRDGLEKEYFTNHRVQLNQEGIEAVFNYLLELVRRPDLQTDIARYEQPAN